MPSINAFSVKFFFYASKFSFVKIQNTNPNPKPVFDRVQTRNPGLEKVIWVWNHLINT